MKRNLRTAEERYSTKKGDFYYYGQTNSKKPRCSEVIKSEMDNNYRRPLSNLKFIRPAQNNIDKKNANLKSQVKKSFEKNNTLGGRKGVVAAKEFDHGNQTQIIAKTNEPTVLINESLELNEICISEPIPAKLNALPVGAELVPTELSTHISITGASTMTAGRKGVVAAKEFDHGNQTQIIAKTNEPTVPTNESVELNEICISEPIPAKLNALPVGAELVPTELSTHISITGASTMTAEHQCCSQDFILKLLDQRDNWLLRKIDSLVDKKLNDFISTMQKPGPKEGSGAHGEEEMVATNTSESEAVAIFRNEAGTQPKQLPPVIPKIHFRGEWFRFPFEEIHEAESLNEKLQEQSFLSDVALHVVPYGGRGPKATLKIFNGIFSKQLQGKFNWENKGTTIQSFPNILSMMHAAGSQIHGENYSEKTTKEMMRNSLRNARAKKN